MQMSTDGLHSDNIKSQGQNLPNIGLHTDRCYAA
jgi:hypothetical protein